MSQRRRQEPPRFKERQWSSIEEIERDAQKLQRKITALQALNIVEDESNGTGRCDVVLQEVKSSIREVFGEESRVSWECEGWNLWGKGATMGATLGEIVRSKETGRNQIIVRLEALVKRLQEKKEEISDTSKAANSAPERYPASDPSNRKVFVVHGHDHSTKDEVADFLRALHLTPIILHKQPNMGRTIIEKLEGCSDVDFAVVLLTPDDVGYAKGNPADCRPRARQNVILEMGFFMGRLPRARVCALCAGDIELPSDYHGIVYIEITSSGSWRDDLIRELRNAGF